MNLEDIFENKEPCVIIGYSFGNNPSTLILDIAKLIRSVKKTYVITNQIPEGVEDNISIINYESDISSLHNSNLFFDDVDLFIESYGKKSIRALVRNECTLTLLSNFLTSEFSLRAFIDEVPGTTFLRAIFTDGEEKISYDTHYSNMTQYQALSNKISGDELHRNVVYPLETDHLSAREIFDIHGHGVIENSPKIKGLIDEISQNRNDKHIIYSSPGKYGTDLIKHSSDLHNIPTFNEVRKFNAAPNGSLLVNKNNFSMIRRIPPQDVKHIHVFDSEPSVVEPLLHAVYKKTNYDVLPEMKIHYHLTGDQDKEKYEIERRRIGKKVFRWENSKPNSLVISDGRLSIL